MPSDPLPLIETWKTIPSYPNYEASNLGNIRKPSTGRILKQSVPLEYYMVTLGTKLGRRRANVHRLVAEAFLGPCPKGYQVNHKDGVKTNNLLSNLEYVTPGDNQRHAYRLGLKKASGSDNPRAILTEDSAREVITAYKAGETIASLARKHGVCYDAIWKLVNGISWKSLCA